MRTVKKPNRENLVDTPLHDDTTSEPVRENVAPPTTGTPTGKYALTRDRASNIINRYTLASTAFGAIPMPGADVVAVSALQADLVEELAGVYGLAVSRDQGKRVAALIAGSMAVAVGARSMFSALKAVPVFGGIVGGGTAAITSAITTYALGRTLAAHLEHGGTMHDLMTARAPEAKSGHTGHSH